MLLFINACVRADSRTKRLADCLLSALGEPATELRRADLSFPPLDEAVLQRRDQLLAERNCDRAVCDLARQFAAADTIVIAAPFWDLSFPTTLKAYLEQINVVGVTFRYTPEGVPEGLCRAKKLYYVTTVGGDDFPEVFGFGYVESLAKNFYGIPEVELIHAKGLDIWGAPVEEILRASEEEIQTNHHQKKEK